MSLLIADCPRCGSKQITFDLVASVLVKIDYDWQETHESFCVCRHCLTPTIFRLKQANRKYLRIPSKSAEESIVLYKTSINTYFDILGYVNKAMNNTDPTPEHLPEKIKLVYEEATQCLAVSCFNASASMFRLCLDLATKDLVLTNSELTITAENNKTLGNRLLWLFNNKLIPIELKRLASCIKNDGNDGAHDGSIGSDEANDLKDFTFIFLEKIYTDLKKLDIAEQRRLSRKSSK